MNGQRTRHNARTAKKGGSGTRKVVAVAGKKKPPKSNKLASNLTAFNNIEKLLIYDYIDKKFKFFSIIFL